MTVFCCCITPLFAHEPWATIHVTGGGRNTHTRSIYKDYTDSIATWMICPSTLTICHKRQTTVWHAVLPPVCIAHDDATAMLIYSTGFPKQ